MMKMRMKVTLVGKSYHLCVTIQRGGNSISRIYDIFSNKTKKTGIYEHYFWTKHKRCKKNASVDQYFLVVINWYNGEFVFCTCVATKLRFNRRKTVC